MAVGRGLLRVRELVLYQQYATGMERKAAQIGNGRGDCCGQRINKHMALSATSAGQCPYLDISIGFTFSLVSQYNVFPHLRHEVPQGRIQNLITMQIQLGCWDAALLLLHPLILPFSA